MLNDLKEVLEEIEKQNDWEHRFVENMLILKEQGKKLSGPQFKTLSGIHDKYCRRIVRSFK